LGEGEALFEINIFFMKPFLQHKSKENKLEEEEEESLELQLL
jgi:hypothetical protein